MKIYTTEEITKKLNKKNKTKKIIDFFIYPIFTIIKICITILLVQKIKNPDEVPNLFGYKALTIVSGSMEPALNIGDLIIIKEINKNQIKKEDIISFHENDSIVTHRIIGIVEEDGKELYQTKGDNNNSVDEKLVKYEEIEGVYSFKIKGIGKMLLKMQNIYVMIILLGVIYVIYMIFEEKEKRKISRHEKRKQIEKENKK